MAKVGNYRGPRGGELTWSLTLIEEGHPDLMDSFKEKPNDLTGAYANIGVSIFDPELLDYIEADDIGIFEKSIKKVVQANRKIGIYRIQHWYHVHDIRDYHYAQKKFSCDI